MLLRPAADWFASRVPAFARAEGPPPRDLLAFFRWCLSGAWPWLIGAFAVWGAASAYLVAIGDTANGLLLASYGLLVVSSVDNFVRPIVIDRRANLNPGLILLGVFGGVYVLGFVGLFVGPVVLGVLTATVKTYVEGYEKVIEPVPDDDAADDESVSPDAAPRSSESTDGTGGMPETDGLTDGVDSVE